MHKCMLELLCIGTCNVFPFVQVWVWITRVSMYFSMIYHYVYITFRSWNWRSSLPNIRWKILWFPVKRRVYVLGASVPFFGWSRFPSAGKNWVHSWLVNKSDRTQISCFWCAQCGGLSGTFLYPSHSIWRTWPVILWYQEVCVVVSTSYAGTGQAPKSSCR